MEHGEIVSEIILRATAGGLLSHYGLELL